MSKPTLKRSLSLPLITFYGLGTILGAGIYVLIGAVASEAGSFTPIALLVAAVIAGFTAVRYSELSSRYPRSASEAVYVDNAFGFRLLTAVVGYAVVAIGIVSAATIARGFAGYFDLFVEILGPAGYRVDTADNGLEAAQKVRSARYDVVVSDIRMPQMNGMQLYDEILRARPELAEKVLFVTGDLIDPDTLAFVGRI